MGVWVGKGMEDSVLFEIYGRNIMCIVIPVVQLRVSHVGRWVVATMFDLVMMVSFLNISVINLVGLSMVVNMITTVNFVGRDVQGCYLLILLVLLVKCAVIVRSRRRRHNFEPMIDRSFI